ncbi:alpha-hydroxy-acid oxidizing protein [Pseudothauera nasutitermitis]|uniref:Alpha-hydroxy-acid oxidizing protein n=1 Tax=Pseudothauera nasutitermitis TaxID=2565930 RepID=A0A4S4B8T8_9RHOO|nr:alpha-hydroxy acid oxidase [Pseudothauera nasutitermitis]THF67403.1 alpha-hydroxy-acid oxidizing protein [Pseudothauera nasutitermitis]
MNLLPPLSAIPRDVAAAADYPPHARVRLDDNAWAYISSGAADELTWQDNAAAFDRLRLQSRVLADVRGGHTRLELFGQTFAHPILLAPVAYQKLAHPDGELATAQAADALDAGMVVSTLASCRIEHIARQTRAPLWFQLYPQPDRAFTMDLVRRAEAAGYQALVVTVDAPIAGVRNREQRAGFHLPAGIGAVNLQGMPATPSAPLAPGESAVFDRLMTHAPTWNDIEALRSATRLPLILKGILSVQDARRALEAGADGIVVSNHGGRTLDTLASAIDALPPIADAVGDRLVVLMDGGIRRGTDVLKALALGARAVMIGRAWLYGLAAAGPLGVAHVIRLLRDELEIAMALTGCRTLADISRDLLAPAPRRD